ncbi:hypothetical protein [Mycolicibacterium sphagni]|uniref:hypothetical protein n=1 Tax=Mycolicibacterium sphagni TaxID=1786 RepID=UPI0021F2A87E|nr:hypothetical protein [Mycolicibacterium sphagni]MCV7176169.1 hypothetical protein [Mycolicibacterium sphagni]
MSPQLDCAEDDAAGQDESDNAEHDAVQGVRLLAPAIVVAWVAALRLVGTHRVPTPVVVERT